MKTKLFAFIMVVILACGAVSASAESFEDVSPRAIACSCGGYYNISRTTYGDWYVSDTRGCEHGLLGIDVLYSRQVTQHLRCNKCGATSTRNVIEEQDTWTCWGRNS